MTKSNRELEPGQVVAGKYRIERVLGFGGMGVVLAATDLTLHRQIAIKALLPALAHDDESVARFLREARAVVRLMSEHTIRVFEAGQLSSGTPYMAMEFLVGADLASFVAERGHLPVGEAVDYILQAIEGVAEAHACGIVHRDLKPANLFMARRSDGRTLVKVLDFGLAKAPPLSGDSLVTSPSAVFGSPAYMSPEQLRHTKTVDPRTDVWALGVCLYEMTTGTLPFDAPNVPEIVTLILRDPARPAHEVCSDVPVEVSRIILRCLEKNAALRYSNLAELAAALEPFASPNAVGVGDRLRRILLWTAATDPVSAGPDKLPWAGATDPLATAPEKPPWSGGTEPLAAGPEKPGPKNPAREKSPPTRDAARPVRSVVQETPRHPRSSRLFRGRLRWAVGLIVGGLLVSATASVLALKTHKSQPRGDATATLPSTEQATASSGIAGPSIDGAGLPPLTVAPATTGALVDGDGGGAAQSPASKPRLAGRPPPRLKATASAGTPVTSVTPRASAVAPPDAVY